MDRLVCRTCLKTNLTARTCINIFKKPEANQIVMKDMLEFFMPEMDLDISDRETVMCFQCCEFLKNAYMFKNICLQTEEKIYNYLHKNNIKLGEKINLNDILDSRGDKVNFNRPVINDIKYSSFSQPVANSYTQEVIIDSNQRNTAPDGPFNTLNKFENEKEPELSHQTQKRKHSNNLKKIKNVCDYKSLKRKYTCDMCEYKAYRLDLLITHKQKHDKNVLNIKEFKCDLCMYSTPRKRALDRHLFIHKKNSQYSCEYCSKSFAEKYQLKLHLMTHSGQELPHKCETCGKGYLTKSYLKQHMETKHLSKESGKIFSRCYKCSLCESSFSDKRGLDAHKFIHTGGELPFKCLHCGFSTAWKGNLRKHLQNKH